MPKIILTDFDLCRQESKGKDEDKVNNIKLKNKEGINLPISQNCCFIKKNRIIIRTIRIMINYMISKKRMF